MTLLQRALRSIENPLMPISAANIAEYIDGGPSNVTGVRVNERSGMKFGAVFRATSLISGLGGSLPLHAYRTGTYERRTVRILENPHPDMTDYEFWRLLYVYRCMWGNSYAQKIRNGAGQVVELWPLPPEHVKVGKVAPTDANPSGKVFKLGDDLRQFTNYDVFHVPGLGYDGLTGCSPIRMAATTIGLGLAAEEYGARLWSQGSLLGGVLQTEQRLTDADATRLKTGWRQKMAGLAKAHEVAVLDSGAKFQPITMPNNDAQFLESRDFQVSEISRWFGIPPYLLHQTEKSTSWGTGLEQQATGFVKFDLHPMWLKPTEARVTKELTGSGIYAKYKLEGLLRGDTAARAEFYNTMRQAGVYNADEIREFEDMPPIPDGAGQAYLVPLNMAVAGQQTDQGAPNAAD